MKLKILSVVSYIWWDLFNFPCAYIDRLKQAAGKKTVVTLMKLDTALRKVTRLQSSLQRKLKEAHKERALYETCQLNVWKAIR